MLLNKCSRYYINIFNIDLVFDLFYVLSKCRSGTETEQEKNVIEENELYEESSTSLDENMKMLGVPTPNRNTSHISVFEIVDAITSSSRSYESADTLAEISSSELTRVQRHTDDHVRERGMTNVEESSRTFRRTRSSHGPREHFQNFERNGAERNDEIVDLFRSTCYASRERREFHGDVK